MREIVLRLTDKQAEELRQAAARHRDATHADEHHEIGEELYRLVSRAMRRAWVGERVYLVLNNTDSGGTGYVVEFESLAAYQCWYGALGDNEEPFGFRGEWGLAHAILTPERALEVLGAADGQASQPVLDPTAKPLAVFTVADVEKVLGRPLEPGEASSFQKTLAVALPEAFREAVLEHFDGEPG